MRIAARLSAASALVAGASIVVTWPQARHLSTHIANHQDAYFSIWRLGWIAHALRTQPLHLFDANIFHPAPHTLAFSDATMLEGLMAAPLFWAGVPPALIYNLVLLAGFAASGLAMFVLAHYLTRAVGPSLVAAVAFTMLPYRIEHFMHLELQWAMFVPLTFWALHRAIDRSSWRWGLAAGFFIWLQLLSCVYYGVFLGMTLVLFVPLLIVTAPRDRMAAAVPVVLLAAAVALMLAVPFLMPYRDAARDLGARPFTDLARYSATSASYFATPSANRVWGWTADRFGSSELRLFPGAIVLALGALAMLHRPRRLVVVYTLTAVAAVELSFGVNGMLYRAVLAQVPALEGFRSLSRFAIIASCALCVLGAFGVDALVNRLRAPSLRSAAVPLLAVLMVVEYGNRPMGLTPADPVEPPDVYKVIRSAAPGAIIELPVPDLSQLPGWDPYYEAWSLWHWKPLVNGYSGYHPRDYLDTLLRMLSFPDDASIGRLRGHDVRYIVVHRAFYDRDQYAALMLRIATRPELKPWGAYRDVQGTADIFELLPVE
jgi:hypothetical protein